MDEIILHHYPLSHFSEKIRVILAYKGIAWRSVEQPMMLPKPDLTPLTGGYRRIPVLQIGADVYCDTSCIARRLERLQPEPACLPQREAALAGVIEEWADHRLASQIALPVIVEMLPSLPPSILVDRAAMSPLLSKEAIVQGGPHAATQALLSLDLLEGMLGNRRFLLGDAFSVADAACFFPLWFLKNSARLFTEVAKRPALAAWFAAIEAFGRGNARAMDASEALSIARDSEPAEIAEPKTARENGLAVGDDVVIVADDYGREETRGTISHLGRDEITIRRRDPSLGALAVHFPRSGYRITKT